MIDHYLYYVRNLISSLLSTVIWKSALQVFDNNGLEYHDANEFKKDQRNKWVERKLSVIIRKLVHRKRN